MFTFSSTSMVYTASCDSFCTTCCIFLAQTASQPSLVYSHTNFLFEYMNCLKIIHGNVNLFNLESVLQRNLMCRSAHKNSGYVTESLQKRDHLFSLHRSVFCRLLSTTRQNFRENLVSILTKAVSRKFYDNCS